MATVTLSGPEIALRRVVGTRTFLQARQLLARGEVHPQRQGPAEVPAGALSGSLGPPDNQVRAVAVLQRHPGSEMIVLDGTCSCSEQQPCPHTVALALTQLSTSSAPVPGPVAGSLAPADPVPVPPDAPAWARLLDTLLEEPTPTDSPSDRPAPPRFALQFEVTRTVPHPRTDPQQPSLGVVVRPTRRSDSGNWVRTGISWEKIERDRYDYGYSYGYGYRSFPELEDRERQLLEELASLRLDSDYSHRDGLLDLAQVPSRRVWDLLLEIRDSGVPLVWAGRGDTVRLLRDPVGPLVDVTRASGDLTVGGRLATGDVEVPAERHQLLGDPVHGMLWWPPDSDPSRSGKSHGITLAPLAKEIPGLVATLLNQGPITVPASDAEAFLGDFYPRLREQLTVVSSDGSVAFPQPPPPRPHLTVIADPEAGRTLLTWSWRRRLGTRVNDEPFPSTEPSPGVAVRLAERFADLPALLTSAPGDDLAGASPRLAPRSELHGVQTARFFGEVLPFLTEDDEVDVEVHHSGPARDYQPLDDAPEISFSGTAEPAPGETLDWFDLAVAVSVGGHDVPFASLFSALAQEQTHLLLPNGRYFPLDRDEYRALGRLIAESRTMLDAPEGTVRLTRFQASAWEDMEQLGTVAGPGVAAWQDSVHRLLDAASGGGVREASPPEGLRATLRPYQQAGVDWLVTLRDAGLGGVLADDMGLGKTIQVLALVLHTQEKAPGAAPYLVVAPTSVVANWAREAARFAPGLVTATITETSAKRGGTLAEAVGDADLVITSYTLFRLEHADYTALPWSGLVLDEAQAVKNHQSIGYRCARDLPAPFKVAVTGTPVENNLMELWSLMSITAPGLFGSAARFADHYRSGIERGGDPELLAQLRRRLRPLMLRRTKDLVAADLPDKQEQVIDVQLSPRQRALYDKYLHRERQKVLGLLGDLRRNRFEIFRSLTLLRQAALDVALVDPAHAKVGSTKLDVLMEQLRDIAGEGHRVLVFSQFTRFLAVTKKRLDSAGIEYCYLDGTTRDRPSVIERFRTGKAPVFLISLKAGGTGLNLTEADYVVLLDPWWNPATEAQAIDRVHRIGQTRKVMVYRLVARNTIEDKVMALKASKSALISSVLDSGDLASGALDEKDIRALLD
ncbi:MAG: hypothetical protein QG622_1919 [Actinomycetota bacterium]|nr:hypothetical protein [Actinomycetota bacterium]